MCPMSESLSSFTRDLRLAIVILFCGALSGINIAKLAPSITPLAAEFGLSLAQIGILASIFTIIISLVVCEFSDTTFASITFTKLFKT